MGPGCVFFESLLFCFFNFEGCNMAMNIDSNGACI